MPITADSDIREILTLNSIAVVGCSSTPGKAAHEIPKYLQEQGYNVVPINPNVEAVLGRPAYDSLSDVHETIDIVDVFRPSHEVADIVEAVIARDDVTVVWLQLGIHDEDAVAKVEAAGRRVVQDRCMKSEHQRLIGLA